MTNGERTRITKTIDALAKVGWTLSAAWTIGTDIRTTMENIEAFGDAWIYFRNVECPGRRLGIFVVLGNAPDGSEVIADNHCPEDRPEFNQAIESVLP